MGSRKAVRAMFSVGRKSYHDFVANFVGVWETLGVFPLVVLKDKLLLLVLNVLCSTQINRDEESPTNKLFLNRIAVSYKRSAL